MVKFYPSLHLIFFGWFFLWNFIFSDPSTGDQPITAVENAAMNCDVTAYAGPDQLICEPGGQVTLNGTVGGNLCSQYWSPVSGLSAPRAARTDAWVTQTTTYVLTTVGPDDTAPNLVFNGDFEQGDVGFNSNYYWDPSGVLNEEAYFITTRGDLAKWDWAPCTDHTSGSGNMLCVNASTLGGVDVWCQTVTVEQNTDYIFSNWLVTLFPSSPAILEFRINGEVIGPPFMASPNTCEWTKNCSAWNSGTATSAEICIVNLNTESWGNDFALDDLEFRKACVAKDSVTIFVQGNPVAENISETCLPGNLSYQVSFEVAGGGSGAIQISGLTGSWNGDIFTSDPIPTGATYFATITDNNNCGSSIVQGQHTCPCQTIFIQQSTAVCEGNGILIGGVWQTQTGVYTDSLKNQIGCDSIVETTLTINPVDTIYEQRSTCNPAEAGWRSERFTNQFGCDSLQFTDVILRDRDTTWLILSSCNPVDTGWQSMVLTNQWGCDSLINTYTEFLESSSRLIDQTSCSPLDTGTQVNYLINQLGCDSIVTIQTRLSIADTTYFFFNSCDPLDTGVVYQQYINRFNCDSIVIETTGLLASDSVYQLQTSCDPLGPLGVFTDRLTNRAGCDSIVTTEIQLVNADTTYLQRTSCDISSTGTFTDLLFNQSGCDSLVITEVTFARADTTYLFFESCDPNQVGIQYRPLFNQYNCDSLIIEQTDLLRSDTTDLTGTTCDVGSVGMTTERLTNSVGCDSLVRTELFFARIDTTRIYLTSCDSAEVGTVTTVLANQFTCDSLIIEQTNLLPSDTTYLNQITCDPANAGLFTSRSTNQYGCDSLIYLDINLVEKDTTRINLTTCDPQAAGTERELLANQSGCDSLIITQTDLLPSNNSYFGITTCNINEVGTVSQNYINQFGCDSIIVTETILLPEDSCVIEGRVMGDIIDCTEVDGSIAFVIDRGQPPYDYQWRHKTQNLKGNGQIDQPGKMIEVNNLPAGEYEVTFKSYQNIYLRKDTIIDEDERLQIATSVVSDYNGSMLSCADSYDAQIEVGVIAGGVPPYAYNWSRGDTTQRADNVGAGRHHVTVFDSQGCVAFDSVDVIGPTPIEIEVVLSDVRCFGFSDGSIELKVSGGVPPYVYQLNANPMVLEPYFSGLSTGQYFIQVRDANGCQRNEILYIGTPAELKVDLGKDTIIALGDTLTIGADVNIPMSAIDTFNWGKNALCSGCSDTTILPLTTSRYELTILDEAGCKAYDQLNVLVKKDRAVYFPNIFSPNEDGLNESFFPQAGSDVVQIESMTIYNRWGSTIWTNSGFNPNDASAGWDGTYDGENLDPAVFVWKANVRFIDGHTELFMGDVLLMK